jgi:hypothetical protein
VKNGNGDLLANSQNILNRQKNYFSQFSVSDIRQIEIHRTELREPGRRHPEDEIAVAKLKKYKSTGSDQIPADLIQRGGERLLPAIHKSINSLWNQEELSDQRKKSIFVPIHKDRDKTDCNNYRGIDCYQLLTKFYQTFFSQS